MLDTSDEIHEYFATLYSEEIGTVFASFLRLRKEVFLYWMGHPSEWVHFAWYIFWPQYCLHFGSAFKSQRMNQNIPLRTYVDSSKWFKGGLIENGSI